ncbi:interferon-related developmental regulator 2 isoform X2 [Neocloeon triangulifer]|uniref:interferon-related developmental regulator 2 isoform X2 n=1 Tax=Neocloeon triangulifer TaxID=2078957 RepID=UPI00286F2057|nr:interferon-related developmental regulator 2 isoform X2 [Neocloeon triangulifer]
MEPAGRSRVENYSDEESVLNDNASVVSIASSSIPDEGVEGEIDEQSQEEVFEEKLLECVERLSEKSAQVRTQALQAMAAALSKKYLPDFIFDRYVTLIEAIRSSLRRGRGPEQAAAALLAPLLCVSLGPCEQSEEVAATLSTVLHQVAGDNSASPQARAKCCWALAVLSFLTEMEPAAAYASERLLIDIFSGSYLKGDGHTPNIAPEVAALHAAALSGWTLLATVDGCQGLEMVGQDHLADMLGSGHLDVRVAAGEALAVLHEIKPLESPEQVCELLAALATDSSHFRAKKERKAQRSSFREILAFIEEGRAPELKIRFGTEALELDTWASRKHYEAFCQVLGSGLNLHLAQNELLRQVFALGAPLTAADPTQKATKLERHLVNAAAFKARTISRAKHRDKRSVAIAC